MKSLQFNIIGTPNSYGTQLNVSTSLLQGSHTEDIFILYGFVFWRGGGGEGAGGQGYFKSLLSG